MIERIRGKLRQIEVENSIRILYACESGSRAWGFASTDSDFDVRFIYVKPAEKYVSILEQKDTIDVQVDGILDINGWDLRKALKLFLVSNAPLYEWLQSPVVYQQDGDFIKDMMPLMPVYFSLRSGCHHYLSMTKNTFSNDLSTVQVKLKKYFYALRPVLAALWIVRKMVLPPMQFQELRQLVNDTQWQQAIDKLLEQKENSDEKTIIPAVPYLQNWLVEAMAEVSRKAAGLHPVQYEAGELDKLFRKHVLLYDL